ncbi:class IIb bacteriocin, lactobin A/cerein 7B family [Thalassotalea aquiviva]
MKELTHKEVSKVSGGIAHIIILGDIAVGMAIGSTLKKLVNKYW